MNDILEESIKKEEPNEEKQEETENILKSILEKESWEDVIYYIVSLENIDPWNVDLVKLTDSFINFVRSAKDLDFRIPAKIVFVSAILLKLKSEQLSFFKEPKENAAERMLREGKPLEELGVDPNLVQLGAPMKRIPKRQVTLEELMVALKAATKVKERRDIRRRLWREGAQRNIRAEGESIEHKIQRIMGSIDELIEKSSGDNIPFKEIVKDWNRPKVVEHLMPVLHLEQERKIETLQEDFFHEIFIRKKLKDEEKEKSE